MKSLPDSLEPMTPDKVYLIRGRRFVYRFSLTLSDGRCQFWFFSEDGFGSSSLLECELDKMGVSNHEG